MLDFYRTVAGREFVDRTVPEIARQLAKLNTLLERAARRAGIVKINGAGESVDVQALRSTAIVRMCVRGVSALAAAKTVGHADLRVTLKHYARFGVEDLRKALWPEVAKTNSEE